MAYWSKTRRLGNAWARTASGHLIQRGPLHNTAPLNPLGDPAQPDGAARRRAAAAHSLCTGAASSRAPGLPEIVIFSGDHRGWCHVGLAHRVVRCAAAARQLLEVKKSAPRVQNVAIGRVEMWRGGFRPNISVAASFVWRCLSGSTMTPFPHPAHRTGHADLPHPALGQDFHAFTHGTSCPSRHRRTSPKCP